MSYAGKNLRRLDARVRTKGEIAARRWLPSAWLAPVTRLSRVSANETPILLDAQNREFAVWQWHPSVWRAWMEFLWKNTVEEILENGVAQSSLELAALLWQQIVSHVLLIFQSKNTVPSIQVPSVVHLMIDLAVSEIFESFLSRAWAFIRKSEITQGLIN